MIPRLASNLLVTLAFAALTLGTTPPVAHAADQVVNNCGNDTELRADLTTLQSGGGTLTFNCGTATISLMAQLPDINTNTTIDGGGMITVSGLSAVRLFRISGLGTLTLKHIVLEKGYGGSSDGGAISNDGRLVLDNTTIQNSYTPFHGGAIFTAGHIDITNSDLAHNIAASGGAIYADGLNAQVTISGSTFDANNADTTNVAGAIYTSVPLSIANSEFTNNKAGSGGAIYARRLVATTTTNVTGSTFHDNSTTGNYPNANGGALLVDNVPATISSSTLRNNLGQSGGAIYVLPDGQLTITNSTLRDNQATNGGGIYNKGAATVTAVTISGNDTSHGGGIDNFGTLGLTNVTLSGNRATYGGGLKNEDGTATLTNVTLSGNSASGTFGGGIFNSGANTHLNLKNVIVADSPTGGNCAFYKAPDSVFFNLSTDNTCGFGAGRDGVMAMLGPLANNGGSTQTHLPQADSPAIDNGTSSGAPSTDQREVTRPQGAAFDVGSVEVVPTPTPTPTQTPPPSVTATRTATPTRTATSTLTPPAASAAATPSATPTRSGTPLPTTPPTASRTATKSATSAASATATPTAPRTATSTSTATPSPSPTPTITVTPTAIGIHTPTPTAEPCGGDCGHDGEVTINELLLLVNVALEQAQVSECSAGDGDRNGAITIDELLVAVSHALNGCE